MTENRIVARWETRGHDFLELYEYPFGGYGYSGKGCGGSLGALPDDQTAITHMERNAVRVLKSDRPSLRRVR